MIFASFVTEKVLGIDRGLAKQEVEGEEEEAREKEDVDVCCEVEGSGEEINGGGREGEEGAGVKWERLYDCNVGCRCCGCS